MSHDAGRNDASPMMMLPPVVTVAHYQVSPSSARATLGAFTLITASLLTAYALTGHFTSSKLFAPTCAQFRARLTLATYQRLLAINY